MKKTYLARRNALLSPASFSWGACALVFAVLALFFRLVAPNLFWHIVTPAFRSAEYLTARSHDAFASFSDAAALTAKNEELMKENAALSAENQALLLKATNVGHLSVRDASGIIAGVIARPPTSPYDTLIIAVGSRGGAALGQEAFGAGGVPVGIVSEVLADFSRVTLFSSPHVIVDAWVGRDSIPLTLFGAGGGAWRASAARTAGIAEGDNVSIPGPGALPIGSVARIDSDPSSPSVTLQILPTTNPFSITWVELRDTGPAIAAVLTWATSTPL